MQSHVEKVNGAFGCGFGCMCLHVHVPGSSHECLMTETAMHIADGIHVASEPMLNVTLLHSPSCLILS